MCGIAGIINRRVSDISGILNNFSSSLHHRGPDDFGWFVANEKETSFGRGEIPKSEYSIGLLHKRLSIIDLSASGWQPMLSEDGRYCIIFNGEIYNYLELKSELIEIGYDFKSKSDTEVLLNAFIEWGANSLKKLIGMFAFAVFDKVQQRLFLARDFFGIKPLYYTKNENYFAFASEIKSLLELPNISRKIDPQGLYDYIRFGMTGHREDTMITEIKQLLPAHYLEIDVSNLVIDPPVKYWKAETGQVTNCTFKDSILEVRNAFLESVELHLRSDVPIGAALSGGVDSSSIVSAIRYIDPKVEIHSFTFSASESRINESRWADIISQSVKSINHKIYITECELKEDIQSLIRIQDEPFGSTSIYAQNRIFKSAQQCGIKVMLDGQGADEMLGGYTHYIPIQIGSLIKAGKLTQAFELAKNSLSLPDVELTDLILRIAESVVPAEFHGSARKLIGQDFLPSWLNGEWFNERHVDVTGGRTKRSGNLSLKTELQSSMSYGLPALLRYEDRNSMAYSIESRVPFLNHKFVELLFKLPDNALISNQAVTKSIFREAMKGIVNPEILNRRDKKGFETPEFIWLNSLRDWIDQILASEVVSESPIFNLVELKIELDAVFSGKRKFNWTIWRWVNFIEWFRINNLRYD